jgi:hypothetical protein
MHPVKSSSPGLETDGKARIIPVTERTEEDRRKVARASARKKS